MCGRDCLGWKTHGRSRAAGALAVLLAGLAGGAVSLHGAATGPASATAPGTSPAAASASASAPAASAPALRPALLADAILSRFPGNASVVTARSDRHNFTVEGRVRDVRRVTVDAAGNIVDPGAAVVTTTEVRVALVGRSQADDVPAHFTCRFDDATEDAALNLKPDQIVRLTGSISGAVPAGDRFDLINCHDLAETGALNVGDQLVGAWRCHDVQVDGAALRKANQARGVKAEDVPEGNYTAPWHIDLLLRADNTFTAELAENSGPTLKRLTGRYVILKDGATEARVRFDVQGGAPQEASASIEDGRLQLNLPGLADRFVLPDTRFGKIEGTMRPMDYRAFKDQTLQWLSANLARPDNNAPTFVSNAVDQAANQQRGFVLTMGAGTVRRGRITLILGAYGKLMPVEYSDAETRASNFNRTTMSSGMVQQWGTLMVPEVKIEALTVENRINFDASGPLTGKITLRSLRRTVDAQYALVAATPNGMVAVNIEKPGPDPQVFDLHLDRLPGTAPSPRLIVFVIGRKSKPNDPYGDNANRIVSEPVPMLVDLAPPK
jgi:hypothetical protein